MVSPFLFTKSHNRKAVKALLNNSARKSKRNRLDHVHCSPQQNQIEPRADRSSSTAAIRTPSRRNSSNDNTASTLISAFTTKADVLAVQWELLRGTRVRCSLCRSLWLHQRCQVLRQQQSRLDNRKARRREQRNEVHQGGHDDPRQPSSALLD